MNYRHKPWATGVEGLLLLGHAVDDGGHALGRLGFVSRRILRELVLLFPLLSLLGRRRSSEKALRWWDVSIGGSSDADRTLPLRLKMNEGLNSFAVI